MRRRARVGYRYFDVGARCLKSVVTLFLEGSIKEGYKIIQKAMKTMSIEHNESG